MSTHEPDHGPESVRLASRLHESMEHVHADPDRLLTGAVRVGRARRRRRRLVTGVLAGVTVAGLGVGSTAAVSTLVDRSSGTLVAAPPASAPPSVAAAPTPAATPSSSAPTPTVTPSRGPVGPEVTERRLPARVAALHLSRLVPSGELSGFTGQQSDGELYVELTLDRGEGPVGVQVNVQGDFLGVDAEPADVRAFYRCPDDGYLTCEVTRDRDGGQLMQTTQRVGRATVVTADHLRPDRTRVVVMTGNTLDLKYGGAPRRGVGLSQAVAAATAPVWQLDARPSAADVKAADRQVRPWTLLPG